MKEKPTNPKDALGVKKVSLHCIPCGPLLELGLAMLEGGRKYGTHNYRDMGVRASVYYDAAMRHIMDWWEGEDIDPDSGLHHVIKAMASLVVLRDSMLMGNCDDDRPYKYSNGLNILRFNKQAAKIIEKYPECVDPFLEKNRKYPKPLINKLGPLMTEEAWEVPANATGHATIELVPKRGWQIRLANGNFLSAKIEACKMIFMKGSIPFYYITKIDAERILADYLETLK